MEQFPKSTSPNSESSDSLWVACNGGSLEKVRSIFSSGVPLCLNYTDLQHGTTPLLEACKINNVDIVRCLIENGAAVDASDKRNGETPLYLACSKQHVEVVKFLILKGADINCKTNSSQCCCHIAVSEGYMDILRILLGHGADVNVCNTKGNSPLHWAAAYESIEALQLLLKHGASIDLCNEQGKTPLDLANTRNKIKAVELLAIAKQGKLHGDCILEEEAEEVLVAYNQTVHQIASQDKHESTSLDECDAAITSSAAHSYKTCVIQPQLALSADETLSKEPKLSVIADETILKQPHSFQCGGSTVALSYNNNSYPKESQTSQLLRYKKKPDLIRKLRPVSEPVISIQNPQNIHSSSFRSNLQNIHTGFRDIISTYSDGDKCTCAKKGVRVYERIKSVERELHNLTEKMEISLIQDKLSEISNKVNLIVDNIQCGRTEQVKSANCQSNSNPELTKRLVCMMGDFQKLIVDVKEGNIQGNCELSYICNSTPPVQCITPCNHLLVAYNLRRAYSEIQTRIDVEATIPFLYSNFVLDDKESQELDAEKVPYKKVKMLIDILLHRKQYSCMWADKLIESLQQDDNTHWLADRLLKPSNDQI